MEEERYMTGMQFIFHCVHPAAADARRSDANVPCDCLRDCRCKVTPASIDSSCNGDTRAGKKKQKTASS